MKADLIKRKVKKEFNGWWMISLIGAVVILLPIFLFSLLYFKNLMKTGFIFVSIY